MDAATVKATKIFRRVFAETDRYPAPILATVLAVIVTTCEGDLYKAQQMLKFFFAVLNELKGGKGNVCT